MTDRPAADVLAPLADLPGVAEAVDATRAAMDALLREPALRRGRGEVRAATRLRSAWASAHLEGCGTAWDDFAPPFADDADGRLAAAALRVAGEVGVAAAVWRRAPLQTLAHLHTLAVAGEVGADVVGRPRAPEVAGRLTALADAVAASGAPGVVVSGVVHGELVALQPFQGGNGLVARAASRVALVATGVDPDALIVPEMGLLELRDGYRDAADAYGSGTPEGLAHWLTFHAAAVRAGISFTRTLCR